MADAETMVDAGKVAEDIGWRMVAYCSDDVFGTLTPAQIWLRNRFEMMCPNEDALTMEEAIDRCFD